MMNRVLLLPLLLTACFSVLPEANHDPLPVQERADRIAAEVARIRDLELRHPVAASIQDEVTAQQVFEQVLEDDWNAGGAGLERAYKALGLVPPELDMKPWLADFLKENVVGYYDTETKEFFLVEDAEDAEPDAEDGDDWEDVLEMDDLDRRLVMPHELVHALEDQHFDLERAEEERGLSDDESLGFTALVEGAAMEGGMDHCLWSTGLPLSTSGPMLRRFLSRLSGVRVIDFEEVIEHVDDAEIEQSLAEAPPIIQHGQLFPYLQGWGFVNRIRSEFGWRGVDAAYHDPPESSEQILFPERYLDRRDRPVRIELPSPPAGWTDVHQDTLGMFGLRVLLTFRMDADAGDAADGWDGDRYVVWETPDGDALGWVTVWDYAGAAREFAETYEAMLRFRHGDDQRWAVIRRDDVVAIAQSTPRGAAEGAARTLLESARLTRAPDDQAPDRWYWKVLRFPVALRPLDQVWETHLLGGLVLDYRVHDDGHRFDLLRGMVLNTENNPDRTSTWLGLGLLGFTRDRTLDYTFVRLPLVFYWHGRGEGDAGSLRWSLLPFRFIDYLDQRGTGEFDFAWGLLFRARWGEATREGKRVRVLGIPIPGV